MRVLLVEDQLQLAESVAQALKSTGLTVDVLHDGVAADLALSSEDYAMAILDVGLPRMDGFEVLARVRARGKTLPVLMLTAREEVPDRIAGLRAGADDYLAKPFDLEELSLRLQSLVARASGQGRRRVLQVGDLVLNLQTLEATRGGQPLHLYPAGRKILEVLMRASPGVVTRARLEDALWGDDTPDADLLRSHVYELRRSVDGPFPVKLIQTLPRTGYRLAVPHASGDA